MFRTSRADLSRFSGTESTGSPVKSAPLSRNAYSSHKGRSHRDPDADHQSFAGAALKRRDSISRVNLDWIPATSNVVEYTGIAFSRFRRAMGAETLETVLFLHYNRAWWDASVETEAIEKM